MVLFRTRLLLILFCFVKTAFASSAVDRTDPFLSQCGHAPIRFFENKLFVISDSDRYLNRNDLKPLPVKFKKPASLDYQIFDGLEQFVRVRAVGPNRDVKFYAGEHYPVLIEGLASASRDFEVTPDEKRAGEPALVAWIHNEDATLSSLAEALPTRMRLDTEDLDCPLPDEAQWDVCENRAFPFDPSRLNPRVIHRLGGRAKRPAEDQPYEPKTKLLKRISRQHDARGFAYAVQYVDRNGELHPRRFKTRYTSNPYFIFDLLTRTPCPDWKIKRVALNAHQEKGGDLYAYRYDEKSNLLLQTKVMRPLNFERREQDIYAAYAESASIGFLACSTLSGPGNGVGDFFSRLNAAKNPVGEVLGYAHKCIPLLPNARAPALGERTRWRNPTLSD